MTIDTNNQNSENTWFWRPLTIALLLYFIAGTFLRAYFLDYSDGDSGIIDDHFINTVLAKNISQGNGWSTSGFEIFPLNPEAMSTGPTVILPASLAIYLFGNEINIPGMAAACLNISLLLLLVSVTRNHYKNSVSANRLIASAIVIFCCFFPHYWHRLTGEIPAILLTLISIFLLVNAVDSANKNARFWFGICLAGLAIGLAITSKHLVLIIFLGLFAGLSADLYLTKTETTATRIKIMALFLIAAFLPLSIFKLYKLYVFSVSDPDWVSGVKLFEELMFNFHSGGYNMTGYLTSQISITKQVKGGFLQSLGNGLAFFNGSHLKSAGFYIWFGILIPCWVYSLLNFRKSKICFYLALSVIPACLWFFLVANDPLTRYLFMPVILAFFMCGTLINSIGKTGIQAGLWTLFAITLLSSSGFPENHIGSSGNPMPQAKPKPAFWYVAASFPKEPSTYLSSASEVNDLLAQTPTPKKIFVTSMWSSNVFEFSSKKTNLFTNTSDIFVDYFVFDEKAYLDAYPEVSLLIQQNKISSAFEHYRTLPFTKGAKKYTFEGGMQDRQKTDKVYAGKVHFSGIADASNTTYLFISPRNPSQAAHKDPAFCGKVALENIHFRVVACDTNELASALEKINSIGFRPMKWIRPRLIYPEDFRFF